MQAESDHRNNFDLVRLTAALFVLLSHQFTLSGLPEPAAYKVQTLGGLGVLIFFVISGFLVARSWQADPHAGRFALRRLLRIWPGLAVVILLTALVLGPALSSLSPVAYFSDPLFARYLKNLQFNTQYELPLRFDGNAFPTAVNGALWTIPEELKCYVLLALAAMTGLLRWRWLLLALLIASAALYFGPAAAADSWAGTYHWTHQRRYLLEFGLFFFAGSAFYTLRIHDDGTRTVALLALCWLLGAAALAAGLPMLALWLTTPITVLAIGNASTPYLRQAGRFGDLSYGVYIYAFPVQQTLIWTFRDRLSWTGILLSTLCTVVLLAFASWHLVEKRALRLKPRRPAPAPELAAAVA